jgi:uncharacterized membrane protein SirB2
MIYIPVFFVILSFLSFITRVVLATFNPELLKTKAFKIIPHVLDTFLLVSGISLVVRGDWLANDEYGWILSKFITLMAYIGLGVITMRSQGLKRWVAFISALLCFSYILVVAMTKQGFIPNYLELF